MCCKIETSFILFSFLKKRENCTVYDLVEKKYLIEKKIPSVFIDVSMSSILSCIAYYPDIFEIDDDKIHKKNSESSFFDEPLLNYFEFGVDNSIKSRIKSLLNE